MNLKKIIKQNEEKMQKDMKEKYLKKSAAGIVFMRKILTLLEKYSEGKLLDAGAGRHFLYEEVLKNYCSEYEALDIIDSPNLDYRQDIQDMSIDSGEFNTVFCRNVLEHVKRPQDGVNEISRILKNGGKAIISAPHLAYLHNEPHDYYRFTKYGLEHMIERAGLEVIEIREAGGFFSFLGYIKSTGSLGLTYHIPVLSKLIYYLNQIVQFSAVKLDEITKNSTLLPLNYIIIAKKVE